MKQPLICRAVLNYKEQKLPDRATKVRQASHVATAGGSPTDVVHDALSGCCSLI